MVVQMHGTYTVGLFTRKERGFGNKIVFEANNLQCASLTTKLAFQAMVDRGSRKGERGWLGLTSGE